MKTKTLSPRYIAGFVLILITMLTSYLVYKNPNLNMAALFNAVVSGGDSVTVYVPSYEAEIGEEGLIEVKAKANTQSFDSLSFVLKTQPPTALTFTTDSIVFDNQTLFQNASVKTAALGAPGTLEVTIILNDPVSVSGVTTSDPASHKVLFKLNTKVADNLTEGEKVNLTFEEFAATNGQQAMNFEPIPATFLTLKKAQEVTFEQVLVSSVNPPSISNQAETNVVLSGQNLNLVKEVKLGTEVMPILNQSETSLTIKVKPALTPQAYDIVLSDQTNPAKTFSGLLTVTDAATVETPETESPDAPKIDLDRSYTNPAIVINDGKTPLTLYTFVEDADLKSVLVNLTNIGQVGTETEGTLGEEAEEDLKQITCPTQSNVIVCMKPSIKEGGGQWFILTDITVSESLETSQTPYEVEVMAIDEAGNTSSKMIPISIGSEADIATPRALVAVPTSETSLEILFSKEMDEASLLATGEDFAINDSTQGETPLTISKATLDDSGKIVTLTTSKQQADTDYRLTISPELKDLAGKPLGETEDVELNFTGFVELKKAPVLDYLSPLDSSLVELEFQNDLKLSSLLDLKTKLYEADKPEKELKVKSVKLMSSKLIRLETETQIPERKYRVDLEGLTSYDGTTLPVAINRGFKGYNLPLVHQAASLQAADLDNNGTVDFADFTIFSSLYGKDYSVDAESN